MRKIISKVTIAKNSMLKLLPDVKILFVMRMHDRPLEKKKKITGTAKTITQCNGFIIVISLTHICDYIESAAN